MPRGVYERKKKDDAPVNIEVGGFLPDTNETEEQIFYKLEERFSILELLTRTAIAGETKALIVSGPAGLGKSYTVEKELENFDPSGERYTIVKGYVRATGLYKLLFQHRNRNNIIVFDDADRVFFDDLALTMLKAVCDTTEVRRVSYLAETSMFDEKSAQNIPKSFEFNGTIIFITNIDFDRYIESKNKIAPHLQALVSRSHYIDLDMKTRRDYLVRIKQVISQGMLANQGLTEDQQKDVVDYIEENLKSLRELSLRMAIKIGILRKTYPDMWKRMAKITCHRVKKK